MPENRVLGTPAIHAATFKKLLNETERVLLEVVNRERAVIDLINIKPGEWNFKEFVAEVENQGKLTRAHKVKITKDDLTRMALIAG